MIEKVATKEQAMEHIKSGQTMMFGDFLGHGAPDEFIDRMVASDVDGITLIACTTGQPDYGCGKLVVAGKVKKAIVSHIGTNPRSRQLMEAGKMEIEFVPQGTLAERIRCGGAGLGGVLTPTGLGTDMEKGKEKMEVGGKTYLLETPLRADVAVVRAWRGDPSGNLVYRRTSQNFNPLIAMAADFVIAEVEELVPYGSIDQDHVITPGPLVNMVIPREGGAKQ